MAHLTQPRVFDLALDLVLEHDDRLDDALAHAFAIAISE